MEEELFSKDDYQKIIHNCVKNPNAKFVSAKMTPLSETAEGFMGEHYKLIITYEVDDIQKTNTLFVKTKPQKNKTQAELASQVPIYEKEIFYYEFVLKEFEKYGFDVSFSPKIFYSIPDQTLVLEDLSTQGFRIAERNVDFDMDRMKCVLKTLAQLHAASFAYDRKKSEELGKEFKLNITHQIFFADFSFWDEIEGNFALHIWKTGLQSLKKLSEFLPKDESYKSRVKQSLNEFKFGKVYGEKTNLAKAFGHGDLWSNNMMFKYQNDVPTECKLVDYQGFRYFYPAYDVILAIYSNTNREFRKKYLDQLYQYYYSTLSEVLLKYGYKIEEIMPVEDFYRSVDLIHPDTLLHVAVVLLIVYLPKDMLTKSVDKDSNTFQEILFDNEAIYVAEFKKNDKFREVASTVIYDLFEAIEAANK